MEKPTSEERNESESIESVDLKSMSNEQLQDGINANLKAMVNEFVSRLKLLEQMTGRKIDVQSNAKLWDKRKIHIRVK